ncbi:NAD(+) diphosphatase [uncultured Eubacterium sp.]|uniref:NAD(+) diphosphatase n=1 Tax=uncultured Eubacterium sp. TaxID=165185 RepID=UPI0025F3BC5B|nr:NAD(+) diphosphatase [uncultured Eubacterium sp.]
MIQDIAPFHFNNEWHKLQPEDKDWIICMQERKILLRGTKEDISFPRYDELKEEVQNGDRFVYLFAVGEERFFLYQQHQYKEREELNLVHLQQFHYETTRYLRGAAPQHLCYAGLVGAQLAGWYAAHRFCGGCGTRMISDERERMMRCPVCGQMEYPKICPCVIVGVMHKGKILVSWYKNGFRDHYALIAGFAEVGETIEETVAREVYEETHLHVKNLHYYKSQPWPYSESLLFGFFCELDGEDHIIIQEDELAMAKWVTPEEIFESSDNFSLTNEMICKFKKDMTEHKHLCF